MSLIEKVLPRAFRFKKGECRGYIEEARLSCWSASKRIKRAKKSAVQTDLRNWERAESESKPKNRDLSKLAVTGKPACEKVMDARFHVCDIIQQIGAIDVNAIGCRNRRRKEASLSARCEIMFRGIAVTREKSLRYKSADERRKSCTVTRYSVYGIPRFALSKIARRSTAGAHDCANKRTRSVAVIKLENGSRGRNGRQNGVSVVSGDISLASRVSLKTLFFLNRRVALGSFGYFSNPFSPALCNYPPRAYLRSMRSQSSRG